MDLLEVEDQSEKSDYKRKAFQFVSIAIENTNEKTWTDWENAKSTFSDIHIRTARFAFLHPFFFGSILNINALSYTDPMCA